jgi:Ca2+-binding EF-hand superfamily protein
MKKVIILTALLISAALAADYSQVSTEELMNMRGTISVNEQPAFRAEMQKRMQTMTPTQRQELMQRPANAQGMGKGMNSQRGQGMNRNKGKGRQNRPTFTTYDLNNDGKITQKEFYDGQAERMTQKADEGKMMRNAGKAPTFESIDANSDGVVTQTEFSTHQMNRMNRNMRGMGQGRGGKGQAAQ